jgi:hypothetical protein
VTRPTHSARSGWSFGLTSLLVAALVAQADGATLRVGPDKFYKTVRSAAEAAWIGDVVLIDAGVYKGDVTAWKADNITVRGVGGRAHLRADGAHEGGKGTWVVTGRNFTAENIEFSGASVPDKNGAGIRSEGSGTLTVRNCVFHDNEQGILGSADSILIESCVFDRNGSGDGRTHNLYVWGRSFTIRNSVSRRAVVGHEIKTRAQTNYILYNAILDEKDGTASYSIDVPDCGRTYIIGNVIQQGPKSENSGIVSYGAESAQNVQDLYVVNNTVVNDRADGATFVQLRDGARATITNNVLCGPGTPWTGGRIRESHNFIAPRGANAAGFANPSRYDYHLTTSTPPGIVDAGHPPGRSVTGFGLAPTCEHAPDASGRARAARGPIDLGAFEFVGGGGPP